MSVCNQTSDPSQLWAINLASLWRISWEQNTVGWYPVDVLFLLACREILFVSTIYYLYTYLYCDTLPGQPFAQNAPAHTYTGRRNIFPLQSPRLCAHTHTLTHKPPTKMHTSHSTLPPSSSHDEQHKLDAETLTGKISLPLCTYCIHLHPCISVCYSDFFFFLLFSVFRSQLSACDVRSRSPYPSESF